MKLKGLKEEIIDSVVARVLDLGYLNDSEYSIRRARLMAEKGYGDFYIKTFLEGLGVPEDMAASAVDKVSKDFTEEKRISHLVSKRKGLSREKMIRFLAGKGLAFEKILSVLGGDDQ